MGKTNYHRHCGISDREHFGDDTRGWQGPVVPTDTLSSEAAATPKILGMLWMHANLTESIQSLQLLGETLNFFLKVQQSKWQQ